MLFMLREEGDLLAYILTSSFSSKLEHSFIISIGAASSEVRRAFAVGIAALENASSYFSSAFPNPKNYFAFAMSPVCIEFVTFCNLTALLD